MATSLLHCCWILVVSVFFHAAARAAAKTPLNLTFVLITSYGRYGFNSSGTLPAADIALERINNRPDLLPGYNLFYDTVRNSECDGQLSLDAFFDGIRSHPVKIGVIGCGCSVATEPVAAIVHFWNIPLISYGTTSSLLSNTTVYRNYFRANPPSTALAPALLALTRQFNWQRIGLLTQDENRFRRVETRIQDEGIQVGSRTYSTAEDPTSVDDIFLTDDDYRVFLLNSYPNARIICEAYKRGFLYPKYLWLAYGWYAQASWTNSKNVNCTEEQLRMVLENGISVEVFPIPYVKNMATVSGLTPQEFQDEYQARVTMQGYEALDTTAAQLHDDVWGLALALNATMTMVNENNIAGTGCENLPGELVPLEDFTYNNSKMGCLITWNLRRLTFSGVSGVVHFNESLLDHRVTLLQYQLFGNNLTRTRFATVNNSTFQYDEGFSADVLYPGPGGIPLDGTPLRELRTIVLPLVIVVDILATLGIVFAVCCLVFNIVFRKRKVVKVTSPTINYFIIAGTILMYASIYFYLTPAFTSSVAQAGCLIREWLFIVGYTLAYGALLSKLWRIYTIFQYPVPKKKIFKDWELIAITLGVTGGAVLLLFLGSVISPLRGNISETNNPEYGDGLSELAVRIQYFVLVCYEEAGAALYWRIFLYAYLLVLQIVGIMLAFQTRKVKIKSLKDSTFVAANVYISSIVIVIFVLVTFALRTYVNAYSGIFAVGILILTTMFLALTFVPKMVLLYKDPNGESLEDTMTDSQTKVSRRKSSAAFSMGSLDLEGKIADLERKLTQRDETIDKMKSEMEAAQKLTNTVLE